MRLPLAVYELADRGCISGIHSPDWRKRKISVEATEAAFDLFIKELREPLLDATQETLEKLNPETAQEVWATHLIKRFDPALVSEADREQFVEDEDTKTLILAASHEKLAALAIKFNQFHGETAGKRPGAFFGKDLMKRMENIFSTFFQPEWQCFDEFSRSGKAPMLAVHALAGPAEAQHIYLGAVEEIARRMKSSDFPLEITSCLVEDRCRQDPHLGEMVKSFLSKGGTFRDRSTIGW